MEQLDSTAKKKPAMMFAVIGLALICISLLLGGYAMYAKGYLHIGSASEAEDTSGIWENKIKTLQSNNAEQADRIVALEAINKDMKAKIEELQGAGEKDVETLKTQLKEAQSKLAQALQRANSLQGRIDAAEAEKRAARSTKLSYQKKLKALKADRKKLGMQMEQFDRSGPSEIRDLREKVAYLENALAEEINDRRERERLEAERLASIKEARRVELSKPSPSWSVQAASKEIAFIKNNLSGDILRVTRGFEIPGCGGVVAIEPDQQKVTAGDCVIQ